MPFYHTHTVADPRARRHTERYVTQEDVSVAGATKRFRIRPDLVFAIERGAHRRIFFLEGDRGNESRADILQKQIGYHHYARYPDAQMPDRYLWQRYADAGDFRVLFVTTTERRIRSLENSLKDHPGFALMAFATEDELKARHLFFDPMWRVDAASPRSLLKPEPEPIASTAQADKR